MTEDDTPEHAPRKNRSGALVVWLLAMALLAVVRYRGELGVYKSFHVWLAELGVPDWVRASDTEILWIVLGVGLWRIMRFVGPGESQGLLRDLGLRHGALKGIAVGGVICIPIIAVGIVRGLVLDDAASFPPKMIRIGFSAPIAEEWFFRGVLVLALVQLVGVKFWTATIVSAVFFGLVHVRWTADGIANGWPALLTTGAGGVWFAWLAHQWSRNLYVPITAHMLMNLAPRWYGATDHSMSNAYFVAGWSATIALGTVLTIRPGLLRMSWAKSKRVNSA